MRGVFSVTNASCDSGMRKCVRSMMLDLRYGVPVISVLSGSSYFDAIVKSAVGTFQVFKRQEEYRV
jgi:hypothetical protein